MAAVHDKQTIAATGYESQVGAAFKDLDQRNFIRRLWQKDATLWSKNPAEQKTITNALGWLTIADAMAGQAKELASFADEVREAGFRDVVLLGMGGSSQSADLFAATFPAGTLVGAPKVRAMEIIEELEPVRRGLYGGTLGYFGAQGDMDQAITIRTLVFHDDEYSYQAGAGLVADSVPAAEHDEVLAKSAALLGALKLAGEGL